MLDTLAVVVTYNRKTKLKNCVYSLLHSSKLCDILIVDNASTDGTEALVQNTFGSAVIYEKLSKNTGGAGGFAYGLAYAAEHGYKYAWLMDDDCVTEEDSLTELFRADRYFGGPENYGFLTSRVLWTDGSICKMNNTRLSKNKYQKAEDVERGYFRLFQATFVSMLIPCSHLYKYGLPYAEYFIWNDDIEFTRRLSLKNNLPCYRIMSSKVVHDMESNVGSNIAIDSKEKLPRYRIMYRNERNTYCSEGFRGKMFYILVLCRDAARIVFKAKDSKAERFKTLAKGARDGREFKPELVFPK